MVLLKKLLLATYPLWAWLLPKGYRLYRIDGRRIYLDISESRMMLARVWGAYDPAKANRIGAVLKPGQTFVDVGANKGDFSLLAAGLVGESGVVLAIEPEAANCHWLSKSVEANGFSNVHVHELALGDANGETLLNLGRKSGWHSLAPLGSHGTGQTVTVTIRRLDDLLDEIVPGRKVDMIKIDVEGAEMAVLRGARRALQDNPDIIVLIEIHENLGVNAGEIEAYFQSLGFEVEPEASRTARALRMSSGQRAWLARRPAH